MKQKDIMLVAVVVIVSAVISLLLANFLVGDSSRQERVEVVEKITNEFVQPDKRYFNDNSINPTQLIRIGNSIEQATIGQ